MSDARKIDFSVEEGIARIVIDDAVNHNVVGAQFTRELAQAAIGCESDPSVRVVLLTARGKEFSVGGDLNEFLSKGEHLREHVRALCRPQGLPIWRRHTTTFMLLRQASSGIRLFQVPSPIP